MGIHQLPQMEDYWSSDNLVGVAGIVENASKPIQALNGLLSLE